jgi:flavodoxin
VPAHITAIVASTSGHTEYVLQVVKQFVKTKKINLNIVKAEQATVNDVQAAEVLLLASSTWNTGGNEGQLNPHMLTCWKALQGVDLQQKPCAAIGLGDERYRYTAAAADHLKEMIQTLNGALLLPAFKVVNEPYGQEKLIEAWAQKLLKVIKS